MLSVISSSDPAGYFIDGSGQSKTGANKSKANLLNNVSTIGKR